MKYFYVVIKLSQINHDAVSLLVFFAGGKGGTGEPEPGISGVDCQCFIKGLGNNNTKIDTK